MFQLYKDRDFGGYISDTIDFFKKFGKHYFKNYFIINGGLLVIMSILMYLFSKFYMEFLKNNMNTIEQNNNYLDSYFQNNLAMFGVAFIVMVVLIIIISAVNFALPSLYIEQFEIKGTNFESKDLLHSLKNNIGRILLFMFASFFVIIPIFFIVFAINIALVLILIGIPLFFITFPAFLAWISLSFNNYLLGKNSYFQSLANGFSMLKRNFWPTVGSSLIMFMIIYMLQTIITMIPYGIGMVSIFTSGENFNDPSNSQNAFSTLSIMMIVIMVLSSILGFIFQNFFNIHQLLVYYSQLDGSNQNSINHEIEQIGSNIE